MSFFAYSKEKNNKMLSIAKNIKQTITYRYICIQFMRAPCSVQNLAFAARDNIQN